MANLYSVTSILMLSLYLSTVGLCHAHHTPLDALKYDSATVKIGKFTILL